MTIGIATRGPGAGAAAMQILRAVEAIGSGAIGGFAVFHWRDAAGALHHAVTQDQGSLTLNPAPGWETATHAAIISSGPNRPEPLLQFLPGHADIGFVTGHRLPSSLLPDGSVLNTTALQAMSAGGFDQAALKTLLAGGPALDAGLICLPLSGPVLIADSPRVRSRDDTGRFHWSAGPDLACALLHNSIHAASVHGQALAEALGGIGREALGGPAAGHVCTRLPDRLPVHAAAADFIEISPAGEVIALHSADPAYHGARGRITAIYQSTPVHCQGRGIGQAVSEVFSGLEPGLLIQGPRRDFVWKRDS